MVRRELAGMPVARLRDAADGRLRLGPLASHGFPTVLAVLDARPAQLRAVPGVGESTATQSRAAARQLAAAVDEGLRMRVDLDPSNKHSTKLLAALRRYGAAGDALGAVGDRAQDLSRTLDKNLPVAAPAGSRVRMLLHRASRREQAREALSKVQHIAEAAQSNGDAQRLADASANFDRLRPPADPSELWKDFEQRSAEYYGWLGEVVDLRLDVEAVEGFLPKKIVAAVHEQQLDDRFRRVSLRGYQSFGARFALVQRRVILGDEMGLGKTIEAIAAIAHLKAMGGTHFLVVCPASVLVNWTREIAARSALRAYRLHGYERDTNLKVWLRLGDVAVTTFDTLRALDIPAERIVAMLVVDEAHNAKNPQAKRSIAVRSWTERAERVLFLTGTPMENRVEEFKNLVGYLQPNLVPQVNGQRSVAGARAFRRAVAPVYLRRNQEDVLAELPDLVKVDEWVEFGRRDFAAYRAAVREGNFMAMRRAAFGPADASGSAKLQRLLEIVDESAMNGRKVVIYSYFRGVLDVVHGALGGRGFGPVTGSVPPAERQHVVDRFSSVDGHAVLSGQIQAGGVGLNIQAASVVVLCEPQVKPTLEDQAIARVHRMGQVRSVQVHRLLVSDSVDQRMVELLEQKAKLFDRYARRSDIAAASPEAVDISEVELARKVVEMEQERLATEAIAAQEAATEGDW